ncbi:MAG: ABC transporter ATP-binding protein [Candidatus Omnitrophica bacterium]|nr:ABC transporter ATP-binding protein [Candidatus Omnitrophota bacterium]
MAQIAKTILEIKNLRVSFKAKPDAGGKRFYAVDGVSLDLEEGSFTALVGESGSGKSVTALSVCRLLFPESLSGRVYFHSDGGKTDLLTLPEAELLRFRGREIAYVFQDPASSLNPVFRIGEQLEETYLAHFPAAKSEARDKAFHWLRAVKIKDPERVYRSFPHELSGGMKQRAMIAMALLSNPRVLIADEPTTALDAVTEQDVLRLLVHFQKEKRLAVLFITHDLPLVSSFAETLYVMEKGRIVEGLRKERGSFRPAEAYTQRLFRAQLLSSQPKETMEI